MMGKIPRSGALLVTAHHCSEADSDSDAFSSPPWNGYGGGNRDSGRRTGDGLESERVAEAVDGPAGRRADRGARGLRYAGRERAAGDGQQDPGDGALPHLVAA